MKILVCGGRNYNQLARAYEVLDKLRAEFGDFTVIHGGARGADSLAGAWAQDRGMAVRCYPAQWEKLGRSAGTVRNRQMLDEEHTENEKIDLIIAFPGGTGTAHMCRLARNCGIPVLEPENA